MAVIRAERPTFERLQRLVPDIQAALRDARLDGWLLYDLHARNPVASGLLGLGDLTRRWFVWVPAEGEPVALTHGIEQGPWERWPWPRRRYVGWRELDQALVETLVGARRIAMEVSAGGEVPAVDLVPAGVAELVRRAGPEVVTSGELITMFYSRWSPAGLAAHRRTAAVLAQTARAAFERVATAVRAGDEVREGALRAWTIDHLAERGCGVGADCIVAIGPNAADPHYAPVDGGAPIAMGDVLLLDLWSKEATDAVYADQTWMAFVGRSVPARPAELFAVIRDARDAAVAFLRERWDEARQVRGFEVDDVTRGIIAERGYGEDFIHRTGHSIDGETHGMGPNIDNLETHETRALLPGVGFSIEPGVYLEDLGLRTEINVYMGEDGPEVTTPDPQSEILPLLAEGS